MADSKSESKVTLHFEGKLGLRSLPPKAFEANLTIGAVVDRLKRASAITLAPQQQLLLFVTNGSDAFMPAPDQTLSDLFKMFASDVDQIGRCLKIAYCTQVFQG
jgi:hypothetical protein